MKIEDYSFGKITIDGKTYNSDLIIYPDKIDANWWRENSHNLTVSDIKDIFDINPVNFVIGTGCYGFMKVDQTTKDLLSSRNIKFQIEKTYKAIDIYNAIEDKTGAVVALHLTC